MGTPDFAKTSLEALVSEGFDIVGVVTQPDRPKGRGYTLMPPPVKVYAQENGLSVYQPEKLRDNEEFKALLSQLDPDVIVVVAYGRILPSYVLDYPKFKCVNVHGSLLPAYRGAAPIQRAIINGEREIGITIMYMNEGLDTGDMLAKASFTAEDSDNFGTVHDKLAEMGAIKLCEVLHGFEEGRIDAEKQDDSLATYAAKIEKADCKIDFSRPAKELHDLIRGLSPVPLAYSCLSGKIIKIVSAKLLPDVSRGQIGEVLSLDGGSVTVKCGEGAIAITELVPEGKGKMKASDFINGRKVSVGDIFE